MWKKFKVVTSLLSASALSVGGIGAGLTQTAKKSMPPSAPPAVFAGEGINYEAGDDHFNVAEKSDAHRLIEERITTNFKRYNIGTEEADAVGKTATFKLTKTLIDGVDNTSNEPLLLDFSITEFAAKFARNIKGNKDADVLFETNLISPILIVETRSNNIGTWTKLKETGAKTLENLSTNHAFNSEVFTGAKNISIPANNQIRARIEIDFMVTLSKSQAEAETLDLDTFTVDVFKKVTLNVRQSPKFNVEIYDSLNDSFLDNIPVSYEGQTLVPSRDFPIPYDDWERAPEFYDSPVGGAKITKYVKGNDKLYVQWRDKRYKEFQSWTIRDTTGYVNNRVLVRNGTYIFSFANPRLGPTNLISPAGPMSSLYNFTQVMRPIYQFDSTTHKLYVFSPFTGNWDSVENNASKAPHLFLNSWNNQHTLKGISERSYYTTDFPKLTNIGSENDTGSNKALRQLISYFYDENIRYFRNPDHRNTRDNGEFIRKFAFAVPQGTWDAQDFYELGRFQTYRFQDAVWRSDDKILNLTKKNEEWSYRLEPGNRLGYGQINQEKARRIKEIGLFFSDFTSPNLPKHHEMSTFDFERHLGFPVRIVPTGRPHQTTKPTYGWVNGVRGPDGPYYRYVMDPTFTSNVSSKGPALTIRSIPGDFSQYTIEFPDLPDNLTTYFWNNGYSIFTAIANLGVEEISLSLTEMLNAKFAKFEHWNLDNNADGYYNPEYGL